MKLDHDTIAAKIDHVYALVASLDRDLAAAGLASWPAESPRRASLAVLEHAAELRQAMHRITVAASGEAASPFIRCDLAPNAYTRAAARAAGRLPPKPGAPPIGGPPCTNGATGDDNGPAYLDKAPPQGPTAAVVVACWPSDAADAPSDTESESAPVALLATL
ncbi:MAG: hypothetical protein ACREPV_13830 [Lysobacter sp.]